MHAIISTCQNTALHLQRIQAGEHPADGAVAADDQQLQPGHVGKQLQSTLRPLPRQLHDLWQNETLNTLLNVKRLLAADMLPSCVISS